MIFKNRTEAGKILAENLAEFAGRQNLLVLALPRGGVPVAYEVAKALNAPMDVFVVRKIGVPGREELAMGAVASGGVRIINEALAQRLGISERTIAAAAAQEQLVLENRERKYRMDRRSLNLKGKTVIVVDDGMATGYTMLATVLALESLEPSEIVVATPAASKEACAALERRANRLVCLETPVPFVAVGKWYRNFAQTTEEDVLKYMKEAKKL